MRRLVPALFLALAFTNARADDWPYEAECRKLANVAIPKGDVGSAPAKCDSDLLYYGADGTGKGADFPAARACAYRERAAKDDGQYSGAVILMMVYANGRGVPRNIPLAKRFACEVDGAPMEVSGRLESLDKLGKDNPRHSDFDVCNDVTSGMMMGVCSQHDAGFAAVKRQHRLDALTASWTANQKHAFALLRKSSSAWFGDSSENEVDMSGTARGMFAVEASETLEEGFVKALERFERGGRPEPGAAVLKAEDARLNTAYSAWMRALADEEKKGESGPGAIRAQGVRESQRKWLAYREAWVAFGAARYPDVPADAWRAWLSHERAAMIKESASGE